MSCEQGTRRVSLPMASELVLPSLEALTALLQCSVCLEVPRGEAVQCAQGHHVCGKCYDGLKGRPRVCPIGRCLYASEPTKSLLVGQLLDLFQYKFACVNLSTGCEERLPKDDINGHEKGCGYRKFDCMFRNLRHPNSRPCSFTPNSLASHVLERHPHQLRKTKKSAHYHFQRYGSYAGEWKSTEWNSSSYYHEVTVAGEALSFVSRMVVNRQIGLAFFLVQADLGNGNFAGLASEIRLRNPEGVDKYVLRGQVCDLGDSVTAMLTKHAAARLKCSMGMKELEKLFDKPFYGTGYLHVVFDLVKE